MPIQILIVYTDMKIFTFPYSLNMTPIKTNRVHIYIYV